MAQAKFFYATGRRKTAAARVFLKPGSGKITINGKPADGYLSKPTSRMVIVQPFGIIAQPGKFDAMVTVVGGGESGQAGAIRHGISRALVAFDETNRGLLNITKHCSHNLCYLAYTFTLVTGFKIIAWLYSSSFAVFARIIQIQVKRYLSPKYSLFKRYFSIGLNILAT